mmetsp:Transcript_9256/g.19792  ORF Transcript_9256/g.19792 Transcript_9256/m.19792 type:complete len:123 (+) Transcript_9256:388-756(+)
MPCFHQVEGWSNLAVCCHHLLLAKALVKQTRERLKTKAKMHGQGRIQHLRSGIQLATAQHAQHAQQNLPSPQTRELSQSPRGGGPYGYDNSTAKSMKGSILWIRFDIMQHAEDGCGTRRVIC